MITTSYCYGINKFTTVRVQVLVLSDLATVSCTQLFGATLYFLADPPAQ